jgi:aminoglycoside phosphotransferase (APT) family kinase protein
VSGVRCPAVKKLPTTKNPPPYGLPSGFFGSIFDRLAPRHLILFKESDAGFTDSADQLRLRKFAVGFHGARERLVHVARPRMHDDEIDTDADLVRHLLASQYPQWADLPIERVLSAGTDNAMYRLGEELAVRLPRIHWAIEAVAKEQRWLPTLAPHLPLPVPVPVARGEPEDAFPHPWSVVRWLPGELATPDCLDDPVQMALDLAEFVLALQSVDPGNGPTHHRGSPVRFQEQGVRHGVAGLRGELDGDAVMEAWHQVVNAPDYEGSPRWFHGDLAYLNLVSQRGKLRSTGNGL